MDTHLNIQSDIVKHNTSSIELLTPKQQLPFHIKLLDKSDITQITHLREKVYSSLPHTDDHTREIDQHRFILDHCGLLGETLGIFYRTQLIGCAMLGYHTILEGKDLSKIIDLTPDINQSAAQLASCMVLPEFREIGLHKLLIKKRMNLAILKGHPHCLSFVTTRNFISRQNLFQYGFFIQWVGALPNFPSYHMLYRNLLAPKIKLALHQTEEVSIVDIKQQAYLLKKNYYGYTHSLDKQSILFAPPI